MVNQELIADWDRTQAHYPQARGFTPGKQETQYSLPTGGFPKTEEMIKAAGQNTAPLKDSKGNIVGRMYGYKAETMPLLVVVHNDAPPGPGGGQYVDVIVKSGGTKTPAERANGHLTNVYDAEAGVTSHLALYSREDMEKIAQASAYPHQLRDFPDGGPPGGVIYSVNAQMVDGPDGIPRVDTNGPMTAGDRPDRYSLHDVQVGMNRAEQLGRTGSAQYAPVPLPTPAATPTVAPEQAQEQEGEQIPSVWSREHAEAQAVSGAVRFLSAANASASVASLAPVAPRAIRPAPHARVSSQAGLASYVGGAVRSLASYVGGAVRSLPSVPPPGEPGSRFNPIVRERGSSERSAEPVTSGANDYSGVASGIGSVDLSPDGALANQSSIDSGFTGALQHRFPELAGMQGPSNAVSARFPELEPDRPEESAETEAESGFSR